MKLGCVKLLVVVSVVCLNFVAANFATAALIAHYPFDSTNTASDIVNSNNATIYGATLADDRFGNQNSAYSFDGTDDYMYVGNPTALKFSATDSWTISVWIKIDTSEDRGNAVMYYVAPTGANLQLGVKGVQGIDGTCGKIFHRDDDHSDFNAWVGGSVKLNDGNWHHLVYVRDDSVEIGIVKLYIDGKLDGWSADSSTAGFTDGAWNFGGWSGGDFLNGSVDDIRIYDTALSEADIQKLTWGSD